MLNEEKLEQMRELHKVNEKKLEESQNKDFITTKKGILQAFILANLVEINAFRPEDDKVVDDYNVFESKIGNKSDYYCFGEDPDWRMISNIAEHNGVKSSKAFEFCDNNTDLLSRLRNDDNIKITHKTYAKIAKDFSATYDK